jgi:hypothetical protein
MMNAGCDCKEKTVFQYLKALVETGGYPIDQQGRKSINTICKNLDTFKKHFSLPESHKSCTACNKTWTYIVSKAVSEIEMHFDGLCLTCMDHTQPKFLDEHMDYWNHLESRKWDLKCPVSHGQATWYSSFSKSLTQHARRVLTSAVGRADTRDWLLKRARPGKRHDRHDY